MQLVNKAYRTEQDEYLRNENYVDVYLGLINRTAQINAKATGDYVFFSKPDLAPTVPPFEGYYATCENNFANERQYFLPRDTGMLALYQGAVTENVLGTVKYTFGNYHAIDIKGLTIDFGEFFPTEFVVSNGNVTRTYTNSKAGQWKTEDLFLDSEYLQITPVSMKSENQRFRVLSIMFGVGYFFDNNTIVSTSWKRSVSHLSDELPSTSFEFTINNIGEHFSVDDPNSFVNFLEEQQQVQFNYGRKLDSGIYRIEGGSLALSSWNTDDTTAKFTAVGYMDYIDGTYYKGQYYPNGRTYYDLATDVFEDAGITDYHIDNYLKSIKTCNPLPVENHKNLLQLIANASLSILYEDREGHITIKSSFTPDATLTTNGAMQYCSLQQMLDEDALISDYATGEENYTYSDGHQYFLPRGTSYITVGYVSSWISDSEGLFSTNPVLTVSFEASTTFFGITLVFGDVFPQAFTIHSFNNGVEVETIDIDETSFTVSFDHPFVEVDRLDIEFTKTNPNQRIHMKKLYFGSLTDYVLKKRDMTASPEAIHSEFVRDVNVAYYNFAYTPREVESKQVESRDITKGENTIIFSQPYHNYSVAYAQEEGQTPVSGTLSIVSSGAYYITFTSTVDATVKITAKEFTVTSSTVTDRVKNIGVDKTCENILIDTKSRATKELGWLCEHYSNDVEYSIKYRGEPAIDPDDQIYMENDFVMDNLIRVISSQIDTSTGMSMDCTLTARRISYRTPALINSAQINIDRITG